MTVVKILIAIAEHNTALELQDRLETTEYEVIAFASDSLIAPVCPNHLLRMAFVA